jgi:hypothetical protein
LSVKGRRSRASRSSSARHFLEDELGQQEMAAG